jgi:hypothetical protein
MNYAKYVFLVLVVLMTAACGSGIGATKDGSKFSLSGIDGTDDQKEDDSNDQRPLIRAFFNQVFSATIQRRTDYTILPMTTNIACRIDDPDNCRPIYREVVNVHIDGSGSAGDPRLASSVYYPQSLSVDFALEVEGSRRCLDQAIDAISKRASLAITGYGSSTVAMPMDDTPNAGSGGTIDGSGALVPQTTIADRPYWYGYVNVAYTALKVCEAVDRPVTDPIDPPLPVPGPLPVESQPAAD